MNSMPLAERLRPQSLDDVIGQQHLLNIIGQIFGLPHGSKGRSHV